MEKVPENQEKLLVPFEESLKLARQLLSRHEAGMREMISEEYVPASDWPAVMFGKSPISYFLRQFPEDIRARFEGHGIYKIPGKYAGLKAWEFHLAAFLNILQNGAVKGDSARIAKSGFYDAITSGDFLLISHADQSLPRYQEDSGRGRGPLTNKVGWIVDVGAYVVGTQFYPMIDDLKEMFPSANIIRANELPEYIKREIGA